MLPDTPTLAQTLATVVVLGWASFALAVLSSLWWDDDRPGPDDPGDDDADDPGAGAGDDAGWPEYDLGDPVG